MAQRVLRAAETKGGDSLRHALDLAEQLATEEEERLELLGAIVHEMRTALMDSAIPENHLHTALEPHFQILRHLSRTVAAIN